MQVFSPGASVKFGWETFKKRMWFFIGVTIVIGFISWVIGVVVGAVAGSSNSGVLAVLSFALNLGLSTLLNMGVIAYALKVHDAPDAVTFQDLWHPQQFVPYLVVSILVFICVMAGLILLIVPGVIIALMLMFAPYLVVDRNMGAIESMKESKRIT